MDKNILMQRINELDLTGKSLDQIDKNKNSLEIACLLAELDETAGYLEVNCYDIFEFGSKFYGLGGTQVKDYKSVAKAFAQRDFTGGALYKIPNIDYVSRYTITALIEIRKFDEFDGGGIKLIEQKYGVNPYTTRAALRSIRKKDDSVELSFTFQKEQYYKLLKICREQNITLYDLMVRQTLERYGV